MEDPVCIPIEWWPYNGIFGLALVSPIIHPVPRCEGSIEFLAAVLLILKVCVYISWDFHALCYIFSERNDLSKESNEYPGKRGKEEFSYDILFNHLNNVIT